MNKLFALHFLFALLLPLGAFGQSPDPATKPVPPFLAAIPDNSACTIAVTFLDMPAKPSPGHRAIDQLILTKSGATRELVSVYTDGSRSEIWFSQGYRLERIPPRQEVLVTPIPKGTSDSENTDFPHLEWLALANYVDIESQGGKTCWHFKTEVKLKEQGLIVNYSAYIDVKTKLPVVWEFATAHYELTSIAPATLSDMPPDFAKALKAYRAAAAVPNAYRKS